MDTPSLSTKRLVLSPINQNDIDFIYELFKRPETNQFSEYPDLTSKNKALQMYNEYLKPGNPSHFRVKIILIETNTPIGTIGLYQYSEIHKRAEVGYDLLKEYWRYGYASEAVMEILRYGFNELGLNRVEATVDPMNFPSIEVLKRCGFKCEGTLRMRYFYKGSWHNEQIYSILHGEFMYSQ